MNSHGAEFSIQFLVSFPVLTEPYILR